MLITIMDRKFISLAFFIRYLDSIKKERRGKDFLFDMRGGIIVKLYSANIKIEKLMNIIE